MSSQEPMPLSLLGQELKNYRSKYNLTQEKLADSLSVDVRTLRRWENDANALNDVRELRKVADFLGIEPVRLGVTVSNAIPRTLEQIDEAIEHGWSYLQQLRYAEGRIFVEKLVRDVTLQTTTEAPQLLRRLARIRHVAGHITSESSRTENVPAAFTHYHEMEEIARLLNDGILLNIALTYEGDMLRRQGKVAEAITYLQAAKDATVDAEARGNTLQLLGRAYFMMKDMRGFENAMAEAAELACAPHRGITNGLYNLGAVYEEYGKSYGWVGQTEKGLEYLDRAEKTLPSTAHWGLVLKTARAMALVRGGDIENGGQLAIEAATLCHQTSNFRMLERVYTIENYLEHKSNEYERYTHSLRRALNGPVEQI